ncbi:response regulator transcription factor [Polymorphum gilvum]|uniref:DNA-binding response regulator n=1 Tax=Polymorphum gilvum (strain LMG 25793 / CGMCC 1.9160 / SL003B-26A1) TaxID=991905 RepID=F2IWG0_POLGS|nr:response regulator transcription factor [Polymorphum gilvum]ADZ69259.1 DNA-binding response regulator [Polymorphum gilvum SL003B-26A1]
MIPTASAPAASSDGKQNAPLVYIVDDEKDICALLARTLEVYGFQTASFPRAGDMLKSLDRQPPDACLIDLGLPDMEGLTLINEIRRRTSVPIIVLSARSHSSDRVMGLEMGADDYVVKPFDPREVVARIRSVLRRSSDRPRSGETGRIARFSSWLFEPGSHRLVSPEGEETFLSTGEAALLEALLRAPRRVLSRDYLLEHGGRDESLDRSIDVRVSRIRKKLSTSDGPSLIRTIYGSGYMLTTSVEWD